MASQRRECNTVVPQCFHTGHSHKIRLAMSIYINTKERDEKG